MKELVGIETFRNPEALLLLALIPIYLFWYIRFYRKQRLLIRLSYDPGKLNKSGPKLSFLRHFPRALQLSSLALIIVAIARPQEVNKIMEKRTNGMEIMLLLDVSSSMEQDDFRPSRLAEAKKTIKSFTANRPNDRIGLILFAATALNYVPLTQDLNYLNRMLDDVGFDFLPKNGTAIGPAMIMGINRMRDHDTETKVMLLITDGANNRGEIDPISAARLAASFDIKTYTIGIGRRGSGRNTASKEVGLDEESLREISRISGGRYFFVNNSTALASALGKISSLEASEIPTIPLREVKDYYPIFVQVAIILLALAYLLMLTFIYNPLEQ
ncbi:MAG: VWA domain-containing protein [Bacteroidia bacterium]|nr:VWA domain-containing protein [Bacteroidia bacterium]